MRQPTKKAMRLALQSSHCSTWLPSTAVRHDVMAPLPRVDLAPNGDVGFGSKTTYSTTSIHVGFAPNIDRSASIPPRRRRATSGHLDAEEWPSLISILPAGLEQSCKRLSA